MRGILFCAVLVCAAAGCKKKSNDASATPPGSAAAGSAAGSAGSAAPKTPADEAVDAAKKVLAAVQPIASKHQGNCDAMKAEIDPALTAVEAETKRLREGMNDPEIAKRLNEMNTPDTALQKEYSAATSPAINCPATYDSINRALGLLK